MFDHMSAAEIARDPERRIPLITDSLHLRKKPRRSINRGIAAINRIIVTLGNALVVAILEIRYGAISDPQDNTSTVGFREWTTPPIK
jgi:hypothetical protein